MKTCLVKIKPNNQLFDENNFCNPLCEAAKVHTYLFAVIVGETLQK